MSKRLKQIRNLEERLKGASPDECARLTKELVRLKDLFINS